MSVPYKVRPVHAPVTGSIRPPGSKSITNRALVVAALAEGRSQLQGVLDSQDTQVMLESLNRLGIGVLHDVQNQVATIEGCAGRIPNASADLWLENSGTSIRFLTALCCLGDGEYRLDGNARMRERPIGDLVRTLQQLGPDVQCEADTDCPPVLVKTSGLEGGEATIAGNVSSQYLSGVLMASAAASNELVLKVEGELVSRPYVEMTLGVMARFGVGVETNQLNEYRVAPQNYQACDYEIEPDASAASYFFATAAITGGKVTVEGLSPYALQGDVEFVDALERMGCKITRQANSITVEGKKLKGIEIDMNAISDTAQTLTAVAVFADGPTRITNVGHMRHKETNRIEALVTELRRMGLTAEEHDDGLTIYPGTPNPTLIQTYDDHRMAMSFALVGLKHAGIEIENPECTGKTYPEFFTDLERLCQYDS